MHVIFFGDYVIIKASVNFNECFLSPFISEYERICYLLINILNGMLPAVVNIFEQLLQALRSVDF